MSVPQLLFTYDFPPIGGGIARMMGELSRRYPPGSLVVSTGSSAPGHEVDDGSRNRVDRIPVASRRLRTVQGLLAWSRRADELARTLDPEFVWCGNLKPAGYPARWVRQRFGTPYGIFLYGTDLLLLQDRVRTSWLKRRTARALMGSAAVLVAISRWTRDLCQTVLSELNLPGDQIEVRVVPLGTDPESFRPGIDPTGVRERYALEEGRWLLTVARLVAHKGIDTVLHVLAALRDEHPSLRYAVVGSGRMQAELEALAVRLGVSQRVRFLTNVPDADLPALYNHAEIYLGVSRPAELMMEGFGISLSEASACGVPVVGGASGGIPDAVRENETGLLVDALTPGPVIEAVRLLLENPDLGRRLGAGGRRAVESFFNWDRVTADIRQLGREFGSQRGRRP
ncbi:MAG TPA: glycosyltransferase family 4 protein [Gemmatimonadales bacterium]|nr:glycosyltransferase family 4 protein [Gemmatimonadales bacterium]